MPDTLEYIADTCEMPQDGVITSDGLNMTGLYYRVTRIADRKVIRESIWNMTGMTLFTEREYGTIPELRKKGLSWDEIFPAALEASCWTRPVDREYQ
jgi:hypothetical protein